MGMHSGFVLSQASDRPMFVQIKDQVKRRVATGDWPPGQEIPSIRGLAAELGVSVITVKRAYAELEQEGVIVTRHGKGSFTADATPNMKTRLQTDEVIRLMRETVEAAQRAGMTARQLKDALDQTLKDSGETEQ